MLQLKAIQEEISKLSAIAKDVYQSDRLETIQSIRALIAQHNLKKEDLGFNEFGRFIPDIAPVQNETQNVSTKVSKKIIPRSFHKPSAPRDVVIVAKPKAPLVSPEEMPESGEVLQRVSVDEVWGDDKGDFSF